MDIQISIIIVNFNTAKLLKDCINSILADPISPDCEIIVVDNDSIDDSINMLKNHFPMVRIVLNSENSGFSVANNQGLKIAQGRYVFLLNPDTILLHHCLSTLLHYMNSHPDTGACGPKTWLDKDKTLEVCSLKILTPERAITAFTKMPFIHKHTTLQQIWNLDADLWLADAPIDVEGIGGAGFFMEKDLLVSMGGLDERFFMGYEDTDLCARISKLSKKITVVPTAEMVHLFGQAKQLPQAPEKSVYAWKSAPVTFIDKHFGHRQATHLKVIRHIDRFWRRMIPCQKFGNPSIPDEEGISLTWTSQRSSSYILEISNDKIFFDKFGKVLHEPLFRIDRTILNRLAGSLWFWRVWNLSDGSPAKPLKSGYWSWVHKNT